MKILKYEIPPQNIFVYDMPKYSQIVHLEKQGETPCFWAEIPSKSFYDSGKIEYEERVFVVVFTGEEFGPLEIGNIGYYVGTWLEGDLVFHLYEKAHEDYPYVGL